MSTEHEADVRHTLGRRTADDRYTPRCRCGWTGDPLTAGVEHRQTWRRAWALADAHVADASSG